MTKMKSANMDVVRFDKSDVIVASRNKVMALSGIGDETSGNVNLTYNDKDYNAGVSAELQAFATAFTAGSGINITPNSPIYLFGDHDTVLSELPTWDTDQGTPSVNGDYIWRDGHFTKQ